MKIDVAEVNKFLKNIGSFGKSIQRTVDDYNIVTEIYTTSDPEWFWKIVSEEGSYDENESISSIQLVQGKKKEVVVYE